MTNRQIAKLIKDSHPEAAYYLEHVELHKQLDINMQEQNLSGVAIFIDDHEKSVVVSGLLNWAKLSGEDLFSHANALLMSLNYSINELKEMIGAR